MFDHIKIEGFRSFKHVDLPLSPLSVLIGPNNSGKSNFLDLMSLMSEAGHGHLEDGIDSRGGFDAIAFGFDEFTKILIELHFESKSAAHGSSQGPGVVFKLGLNASMVPDEEIIVEPTPQRPQPVSVVQRNIHECIFRSPGVGVEKGKYHEERKELESDHELAIFQVKDLAKYRTAYRVLNEFQRWMLYRDFNVGPEALIRQPGLVRPTLRLLPNGANLSSVLNSIQQQRPDTWQEITELLHMTYPDFKTITFTPEGGDGKVVLRWWERPNDQHGVSASVLSDGTLKFLCLIAILKSPSPPPLICIDEPELGLHPDWIKLVAEMMQSAASRTQLIVATHSPQIVARLDPEQVIVAEKADSETRLRRLETKDLAKWLDEFNLSDLWLAGHLGGRP